MNEATLDAVRQWVKKAESDWREISEHEMAQVLGLTREFRRILLPVFGDLRQDQD